MKPQEERLGARDTREFLWAHESLGGQGLYSFRIRGPDPLPPTPPTLRRQCLQNCQELPFLELD